MWVKPHQTERLFEAGAPAATWMCLWAARYKRCFLLLLTACLCFTSSSSSSSSPHTHTHTQRCVWQQSVALTCEWISVERCCKLCKQRWDVFSNDSSPHPLPQLLICLHPSKTRRAASGSAQTTTHDELMMDTWCNMAVSLQLPSVSVSDVMKQLMVPSPPVTDWLLQINTCCYRSELLHTYTGVWFYLLSLLCC